MESRPIQGPLRQTASASEDVGEKVPIILPIVAANDHAVRQGVQNGARIGDEKQVNSSFLKRPASAKLDFGKYPEKHSTENLGDDKAPQWTRDPLPWTDSRPVLEAILDGNEKETRDFFDISPEQATACALWIPTTYFMDVWQIHPYLGITAALKNSGKTSLLVFVSLFSYRPWVGVSITASTVYRVVDECRPSLFIDEIADTFKDKPDVKTVFKGAYTYFQSL